MVGSPFRITARKLPPEPRYSRFYRTFRVLFDLVALIVLPTIVVLAFWPSPFKYPWGIPVGAAVALVWAAYRYRAERDDFGAALIVVGALCLSAGLTVAHWLSAGLGNALLVGVLLMALPAIVLVMLLIISGSADDPRYDP